MFEALFILTTIDTGTRIGRFLVQEVLGKLWTLRWATSTALSSAILATTLVVFGWSYFILTGSVETIWPMFGVANQLLAVIGLAVGDHDHDQQQEGPSSPGRYARCRWRSSPPPRPPPESLRSPASSPG